MFKISFVWAFYICHGGAVCISLRSLINCRKNHSVQTTARATTHRQNTVKTVHFLLRTRLELSALVGWSSPPQLIIMLAPLPQTVHFWITDQAWVWGCKTTQTNRLTIFMSNPMKRPCLDSLLLTRWFHSPSATFVRIRHERYVYCIIGTNIHSNLVAGPTDRPFYFTGVGSIYGNRNRAFRECGIILFTI